MPLKFCSSTLCFAKVLFENKNNKIIIKIFFISNINKYLIQSLITKNPATKQLIFRNYFFIACD